MHRIVILAAFIALVGCKTTEKNQQQAAPALSPGQSPAASPTRQAPSPEPELDPAELRWGSHTIDELGMQVPILGGIQVKAGEMGESKYVRQMKKPLMTAVWYGHGRSLEAWRGNYNGHKGVTFSAEQAITMCGGPAKRQELSMEASQVAIRRPTAMQLNSGVAGAGGKAPGDVSHASTEDEPVIRNNPARMQVAIEMTVKDTPVLVTWTVETDSREAFAAAEKHYFEALCPAKK